MIYLLLTIFVLNSYLYVDLLLPPKIKLIYPPLKLTTSEKKITIKGIIDRRADLYINDEFLPTKGGYFEKEYYLKEGVNNFIIRARKFWGQEKIIEVNINKLIKATQ